MYSNIFALNGNYQGRTDHQRVRQKIDLCPFFVGDVKNVLIALIKPYEMVQLLQLFEMSKLKYLQQ